MNDGERTVQVDFSQVVDGEGDLDPLSHDLLSLTRQAFLADRETPRGNPPHDPRWHRSLHITVPALEPDRWKTPEVNAAVTDLLEWLSDDTWDVTWAAQAAKRLHTGQGQLPGADTPRDVILFSGGLDAVAGVAHLLPQRDLEAVGIFTNRVMQGYQRRTIEALRRARLGSLEFHQIDFSVQGGRRDSEPTRRTRGLVFLSLGATMALRRKRRRLIMAENGIGALNLPLTKSQTGAMTSRSAHPRTLRLFEKVIQLVTQQAFEIETPFLSLTKAQALRLVPEAAKTACSVSESCDLAAAGRGNLERRCGYCSSCILRRMSLRAAAREDWDHPTYFSDSNPKPERSQEPEMLWQAAVLDRALRDPQPGRLPRDFPELLNVPEASLSKAQQRQLLTTYVDEWRVQPNAAVPRFLPTTPLAG